MHGPDADGEEERGAREQHAMARIRRAADARGEAEAGVSTQDRDHHRERDEIGIVSCEHDLLGRPSSRGPPPAVEFINAAAGKTISRWQGLVRRGRTGFQVLTRFLRANRYPLRSKTLWL